MDCHHVSSFLIVVLTAVFSVDAGDESKSTIITCVLQGNLWDEWLSVQVHSSVTKRDIYRKENVWKFVNSLHSEEDIS